MLLRGNLTKVVHPTAEKMLNNSLNTVVETLEIKTQEDLNALFKIADRFDSRDIKIYLEGLEESPFFFKNGRRGVVTTQGEYYDVAGNPPVLSFAEHSSRIVGGEKTIGGEDGIILSAVVFGDKESGFALISEVTAEEIENLLAQNSPDGIRLYLSGDESYDAAVNDTGVLGNLTMSVYRDTDVGFNVGAEFTAAQKQVWLRGRWVFLIAVICGIFLGFLFLYSFFCRELERQNEFLKDALEKDFLTGGDNKRSFSKKAEELLKSASGEYAFVLFDVERFKIINDVFGYRVGDEILKYIQAVLNLETHAEEIFARISGDVFYTILKFETIQELEERVLTISGRMTCFKFPDNRSFNMVVCAGIYIVGCEKISVEAMSSRARLVLAKAKGSHKNSLGIYDESLRAKIIEENEILNDMHAGLKNGEFEVFLQPKVDFITGKTVGAEALVRWRHPKKGVLLPGSFIPVFEKNSFVTEIDMFMFGEVCRLQKIIKNKGLSPIILSVNQSRLHLYNPDYISSLKNIVCRHNANPALLELEITESAFFVNAEVISSVTSALSEIGFRIAMDDFGSGYSSLNMLRDINIDVLKFGQDFFNNKSNTERAKRIIESMVQVSKSLNIETVAEGVETRELAEFLRDIGCDIAQGFFFAQPMPAEEFINFLEREQKGALYENFKGTL